MSGMVERGARALCRLEGLDGDALAVGLEPPVANWRTFIPVAGTVLEATLLPPIPVLEGDRPEAHPALHDWAGYRKTFGEAGARAREPELRTITGFHVLAAWKTWNGMVEAALLEASEQQDQEAAPATSRPNSEVDR
ncbi:MAG: hypothetical protein KY449_11915 [Proteobacteria bacterium]|nr:hypothetical protein [Pseudomonadota bacterium]